MTDEEKKIILDILLMYNFTNYTGKVRLSETFDMFVMSIKNLDLRPMTVSRKSRMVFANKLFPYIIHAWKTEFEHIISYYNKKQVVDRIKFYNIMDKYFLGTN